MTWLVRLAGDNDELKLLGDKINFPHLSLVNYNDSYFLVCEAFKGIEKPEEVYPIAENYIKMINGIIYLNLGLNYPLRIIGLAETDDTGELTGLETFNSDLECSMYIRNKINDENREENSIRNWMEIALNNDNVFKVFRLLSYGLNDFVNTYRIDEIIKNDVGPDYLTQLGIDNNEHRRFTGSANHPGVSGDLARHGFMSGKPRTLKPMSMLEASSFIYNMIYKWLHLLFTRKRAP